MSNTDVIASASTKNHTSAATSRCRKIGVTTGGGMLSTAVMSSL